MLFAKFKELLKVKLSYFKTKNGFLAPRTLVNGAFHQPSLSRTCNAVQWMHWSHPVEDWTLGAWVPYSQNFIFLVTYEWAL